MPWKETCVMDERVKFIGRLLGGEKTAPHWSDSPFTGQSRPVRFSFVIYLVQFSF